MISFLKLDVNIMDDEKIMLIRERKDGDTLVLMWVGLLALAMKCETPGHVQIQPGMPYPITLLSSKLRMQQATVDVGLELFAKLDMIERLDDGTFFIVNFEKHQNLKSIERQRQISRETSKRFRQKMKLLASPKDRDASRDGHDKKSDAYRLRHRLKTKTKTKTKKEDKYIVERVVRYLNQKTDSSYRATTKSTIALISARLREGYTTKDFKKVIDTKCEEWCNTDKTIYLRPQTLFGSKFESYLNQKNIPKVVAPWEDS